MEFINNNVYIFDKLTDEDELQLNDSNRVTYPLPDSDCKFDFSTRILLNIVDVIQMQRYERWVDTNNMSTSTE